jgi:hypothetical protein
LYSDPTGKWDIKPTGVSRAFKISFVIGCANLLANFQSFPEYHFDLQEPPRCSSRKLMSSSAGMLALYRRAMEVRLGIPTNAQIRNWEMLQKPGEGLWFAIDLVLVSFALSFRQRVVLVSA